MDGAQSASFQNTIIGLRGYPNSAPGTLNYFNMWQRAGPLSFGFYGQNGTVLSQDYQPAIVTSTTPTIGTWYHYALTVSPTTFTVYINGAQNGTPVSVGNAFTLNTMYLARSGQINALAGINSVDDLRIYQSALTSAQVQSVYSSQGAPAPSPAMPLPRYAWDFDGTTTDYVSGVAPTTTNGSITYSSGKYNKAIYLNGSTSNVIYSSKLADMSASVGVTLSFWWNQTSALGGYLFDLSSVTTGGVFRDRIYFFPTAGSAMSLIFQGTTGWTSPTLTSGTWYNFTLVATNSYYSIYFNATLQQTITATFPAIDTYGRNASIGNLVNGSGTGPNGSIDDLRIFDRALTSAQVQSIYNQQGMPSRTAFSKVSGTMKSYFTNR
jgi:hypothetical protein